MGHQTHPCLLPLRFLLWLILLCVFYPIFLLVALIRALVQRSKGRPSQILKTGSACQSWSEPAYYNGHLVFSKPFEEAKLQSLFKQLCSEQGFPEDKILCEFKNQAPSRTEPAYGKVDHDAYLPGDDGNFLKSGDAYNKFALSVRVYNGAPGNVTYVQYSLPGGGWDGSSCFNFMKELINRYYGAPAKDVFYNSRTTITPEAAAKVDSQWFLCFLFRLPYCVLVNVSGFVWSILTICCSKSSKMSPEVAMINLDLETSSKLTAALRKHAAKPYAGMSYAAVNAYQRVNGHWPSCIIMQSSLQTRHFVPSDETKTGLSSPLEKGARDLIGDWLIGPLQFVTRGYTLADAQMGYEALLTNLDTLEITAIRNFQAKAYGLMNAGASMWEWLPCFGDGSRLWSSSVFFNNYGTRSMHPDSGCVYWNWAAPADMGCNCIHTNGRTTIAFASMHQGVENVRAVRDEAYDILMGLINNDDGTYGATGSSLAAPLLPP